MVFADAPIPHDVSFDDGIASARRTRGAWSRTFAKPGIYNYYCSIHDGMTGTVTVRRISAPPALDERPHRATDGGICDGRDNCSDACRVEVEKMEAFRHRTSEPQMNSAKIGYDFRRRRIACFRRSSELDAI